MNANVQGFGDFEHNFDGGRTFSPFNPANVVGMNIGLFGKTFLAKTRFYPVFEDFLADDAALVFLEHARLRKQNLQRLTTHAPCRLCFCR